MIKKVRFDVHMDFSAFVKELQTDRIKEGIDDAQNSVALWRLTKTITNMIAANPQIREALLKVKIEDGKI